MNMDVRAVYQPPPYQNLIKCKWMPVFNIIFIRSLNMEKSTGRNFFLSRSNPNKSLEDLSHQDIMRLTREDCRRYLMEKGMRRPSWNKSQAMQQLLSLKKLFPSNSSSSFVEEGKNPSLTFDLNESPPDSPTYSLSSDEKCSNDGIWEKMQLPILAFDQSQSLKFSTHYAKESRQLTIFYAGQIYVYDNVQEEKVEEILAMTRKKSQLVVDFGSNSNIIPPQNADSEKAKTMCNNVKNDLEPMKTQKDVEGVGRKASLQRFLEKRKDRNRGKGNSMETKKPLLMGMFMHSSLVQDQYWSEVAKRKNH